MPDDSIYGSINDEERVEVEIYGEPAAEITVRFEGEDLERLLLGIRELEIEHASDFVRDAALAAISEQREQLRPTG